MTDNEIIKALEHRVKFYKDNSFAKETLDLINRKDEEVKRLQKKLNKLGKQEYVLCGKIVDLENDLKTAKSEAYREFALKVKMLLETKTGTFNSYISKYEIIGNIHDNPELLKGGER